MTGAAAPPCQDHASPGLSIRSSPSSLPLPHSKEEPEERMGEVSRWLVRFQKGILEGRTEGDDGREERRVDDEEEE